MYVFRPPKQSNPGYTRKDLLQALSSWNPLLSEIQNVNRSGLNFVPMSLDTACIVVCLHQFEYQLYHYDTLHKTTSKKKKSLPSFFRPLMSPTPCYISNCLSTSLLQHYKLFLLVITVEEQCLLGCLLELINVKFVLNL